MTATIEKYAADTAWLHGADIEQPGLAEDQNGEAISTCGQAWAYIARPNRYYRPTFWSVYEAMHDLLADADAGIELGLAAGSDRPDVDELLDWAAALRPRKGMITDEEIERLRQ